MEATLIFSQILFNFVVSMAIIVVGALFSLMIYHLISITKELKAITHDFHNFTDETRENINDIVERLRELPILSFFLKRRYANISKVKRGREKN